MTFTSSRHVAVATAIASLASVAAATPSVGSTKPGKPIVTQTMTETYVLPMAGNTDVVLGTLYLGGGAFTMPAWARYISVSVADESGLPTAGALLGEMRYTDQSTAIDNFCGRTSHSYAVTPNTFSTLWVELRQGPCDDGTLAAGSTGTITVTFSS